MNVKKTTRHLLASLTRIADLDKANYEIQPWPRDQWDTGDYVLGEVISPCYSGARLEMADGRETSPLAGDAVIGALGTRAATLEAVGDWRDVGEDGVMDAMTAAGLCGRITSKSQFVGDIVRLQYCGHVVRNATKVKMQDFVQSASPAVPFDRPIILIIGTSMSSGKTSSGRKLVRLISRAGLTVVGAKLTGAGRFRDVLALRDSGAASVFDFVDAGLPSTVCPQKTYEAALEMLLGRIAAAMPDVVVAEAGASPLEPYNGDAAIQRIRPHVKFTILCASDPYAVLGVTAGFGFKADLVSGVATSTTAGCKLVEELTGIRALNLQDPSSSQELQRILKEYQVF